MANSSPVQVIAVTGGKGGVGKSNVSINLSLALADLGRRVTLLDADLGLANIDVLLGITAKGNISDVI
ncbi:P-loop NTPase, partial [Oleiphilus sp. HI0066]|uniref:P-loop NTPase n=2 Tax=Oleiphilus TaxID=141450 RepID=UPI000B051E10